jgi:hypothetical protein
VSRHINRLLNLRNSTHLRDRLLLATARLLAGWPKVPGERECCARFMKEWSNR